MEEEGRVLLFLVWTLQLSFLADKGRDVQDEKTDVRWKWRPSSLKI